MQPVSQVLPSPGAPQGAHTAPVAAVLLVQVVGEPPLEGNLYPLLHVLEPAVHHGCWDGHACKGCQATRKALKVLQVQGEISCAGLGGPAGAAQRNNGALARDGSSLVLEGLQ